MIYLYVCVRFSRLIDVKSIDVEKRDRYYRSNQFPVSVRQIYFLYPYVDDFYIGE